MHLAENTRTMADRLATALWRPVDAAGPAVFRVLFGALMLVSTVRFMLAGWIDELYGQPSYFFKYHGFSWVPVAPVWALYLVYGALAVLALCIMLGLVYRISIGLFCTGFAYTQLLDITNYLNHYYLIVLISALMIFMPLERAWSLDALRRPALRARTVPAWVLYLLRFQVGVVYVFAGLAKLGSDWLLHAQPLNLWLSARTETPIVGPLLDEPVMAYLLSWAGFAFDSTIVLWLSWRAARPYAYAVLVFFHLMTGVLFNIGMFPYIMILAALVFFDPGWPRKVIDLGLGLWLGLAHRLAGTAGKRPCMAAPASPVAAGAGDSAPPRPRLTPARRVAVGIAALYCTLQLAVPLRHLAYSGDVLWNEEGMRFAWKVMVREKHGSVTYQVCFPDSGKVVQVPPRKYLSARQEREMAGQPDLILALARHIAVDFRRRGLGKVEVRAEALVSLNGRPGALMIDPERDLSRVVDGLAANDWILPEPSEPPIRLLPRAGI